MERAMSEFQAQEIQTLPPPAQLSLDPGWLTPMGLVDWYICPWMAERANQLIFPLMLDGKRSRCGRERWPA
ncbi:hypothetical protein DYH09_29515, partial [bacterium CPR1]|nr:hypothetical protein [bacterium CPR1]